MDCLSAQRARCLDRILLSLPYITPACTSVQLNYRYQYDIIVSILPRVRITRSKVRDGSCAMISLTPTESILTNSPPANSLKMNTYKKIAGGVRGVHEPATG